MPEGISFFNSFTVFKSFFSFSFFFTYLKLTSLEFIKKKIRNLLILLNKVK